MKLHHITASAICAILMLGSGVAQAQEAPQEAVIAPVTVDKGPEDALGRGNPQ